MATYRLGSLRRARVQKKLTREDHPDDHDHQVDGPDQLGVLLAAGQPEREGDGGRDDDRLPAPEVELGQEIARQAGLDQALGRVVDAGEHHVADEGEDRGVGVERTDTAPGQPGRVEVELPEVELGRDQDADQHGDRGPDHRRQEELAHDTVVELDGCPAAGHGRSGIVSRAARQAPPGRSAPGPGACPPRPAEGASPVRLRPGPSAFAR